MMINSKLMDVHVSGHAYQEEMVEMAMLLRSKFYVPVHGYASFLFQHKRLLIDHGIKSNQIFVPAEGAIYFLDKDKLQTKRKLSIEPQYIVGGRLIGRKDTLIDDRRILGAGGEITILVNRDRRSVFVTATAVAPRKLQKELISHVKKLVVGIVGQNASKNALSSNIKKVIYQSVSKYVAKEFSVNPLISVQVV